MKQIMPLLDAHSLKIIFISAIALLTSLAIAWSIARNKPASQSNLHRFSRQLLIASITTLVLGVAGFIIANV
ncbi:MAG TPA: hypothetical protein VHM26_16865 [Chitinophagaceae bacterium]|jgi:predicted lysophospholipase L1 biosynthesis ABC-type transport system permease subunit|nr:hypothetical protein [Chitinophagaceae bacterium]